MRTTSLIEWNVYNKNHIVVIQNLFWPRTYVLLKNPYAYFVYDNIGTNQSYEFEVGL